MRACVHVRQGATTAEALQEANVARAEAEVAHAAEETLRSAAEGAASTASLHMKRVDALVFFKRARATRGEAESRPGAHDDVSQKIGSWEPRPNCRCYGVGRHYR